MGSSRKQVTFDLSQEALRWHYPHKETTQDPQFFKRAYKDIQRFMDANGFDRRQCIKEITATEIGAQHSLLGLLRPDPLLAQMREESANRWGFYIIADLKTWADNAEARSPLEHFSSFEDAKARFEVLRRESYNNEVTAPGPDGQPPARLILGLERADGMSSVDILHVRQGKNYLVTDFTRIDRLRDDLAVMEILSQVSQEIGFDFVRVYVQDGDRVRLLPNVPFDEWDNPYFPSNTPGRIAAQYYELLHQCYPLPKDDALRGKQIAEIVRYVQDKGKHGVAQLSLAVAGFCASFRNDPTVQALASSLIKELDQYQRLGQKEVSGRKPKRKRYQER